MRVIGSEVDWVNFLEALRCFCRVVTTNKAANLAGQTQIEANIFQEGPDTVSESGMHHRMLWSTGCVKVNLTACAWHAVFCSFKLRRRTCFLARCSPPPESCESK
jgi:hypothetical protein